MKKTATLMYLVAVHVVLALVLYKSDFIARAERRLVGYLDTSPEMPDFYRSMVRVHRWMDGNVPDDAVVFIGDSLTQSLYVQAVAVPSVNYGIVADTTFGVLQRIPDYGALSKASAVVIAIGTNDILVRSNEAIMENYVAIVEHIPEQIPVVLSAVLPTDEESMSSQLVRSKSRIKDLNSRIQELADGDARLYFSDASERFMDEKRNLADEYHVGDGLHLSSSGNAVWIEELKGAVQNARNSKL